MSEGTFFIKAEGVDQAGPYQAAELNELIKNLEVSRDDLICSPGWTEWKHLGEVWQSLGLAMPFPKVRDNSKGLPPLPSLPNLTEAQSAVCPSCASNINSLAKICPHCSFPVSDFRENKAAVKYTKMEGVIPSEKLQKDALFDIYKNQGTTGGCCVSLVMLIMGGGLLLIPVVGWFLSPFFLLTGFVFCFVYLFAPVRGQMWGDAIFAKEVYQRNVQLARISIQNSYINAKCPSCETGFGSITWTGEGGHFDCPKCHNKSYRQKEYLFYLPKPEAVPNKDMIEAFVER
jgi:Zn finger protein HypA/HybF involved in hydrogenase expression